MASWSQSKKKKQKVIQTYSFWHKLKFAGLGLSSHVSHKEFNSSTYSLCIVFPNCCLKGAKRQALQFFARAYLSKVQLGEIVARERLRAQRFPASPSETIASLRTRSKHGWQSRCVLTEWRDTSVDRALCACARLWAKQVSFPSHWRFTARSKLPVRHTDESLLWFEWKTVWIWASWAVDA